VPKSPIVKEVCRVIKKIPPGKVATYGQIAAMAGNPRDPRSVGWVLHACSESQKLPWYRVINREGKISLPEGEGYEMQRGLLEGEGIVFDFRDRIDLKRFQWQPKMVAPKQRSRKKSRQ
jgi:methylated-DNA-protein-cysteine methyltransferase-like protein